MQFVYKQPVFTNATLNLISFLFTFFQKIQKKYRVCVGFTLPLFCSKVFADYSRFLSLFPSVECSFHSFKWNKAMKTIFTNTTILLWSTGKKFLEQIYLVRWLKGEREIRQTMDHMSFTYVFEHEYDV